MYKFHTRRVKATAGKIWTSNLSKIRKSVKNVYEKCRLKHPDFPGYPTETSYDGNQEDVCSGEDLSLTVMCQDVKTAQIELHNQMTDVVKAISKIQRMTDDSKKQIEQLESGLRVNEDKQCATTDVILAMKENIDTLTKKVTDLEKQNSCYHVCSSGYLEGKMEKDTIDLLHKFIQKKTLNTLASTGHESTSVEKVPPSYPEPVDRFEKKTASPKMKPLRKKKYPNSSRNVKGMKPDIYIYPDLTTWVKLTFIHGGKWGFFLSPTKLETFLQWLLPRTATIPEESQLTPKGECLLARPITSFTAICMSVINYIYCLFSSSKEEVTRL